MKTQSMLRIYIKVLHLRILSLFLGKLRSVYDQKDFKKIITIGFLIKKVSLQLDFS